MSESSNQKYKHIANSTILNTRLNHQNHIASAILKPNHSLEKNAVSNVVNQANRSHTSLSTITQSEQTNSSKVAKVRDHDNEAIVTELTTRGNTNRQQQEQEEEEELLLRLPPPSEWILDIDIDSLLGCGSIKCAFASKGANNNSSGNVGNNTTDVNERFAYGYLVSDGLGIDGHGKLKQERIDEGNRTMSFANELATKFGIRHTLLANPHMVHAKDYPSLLSKSVVLQPILRYSRDSVLFKCKPDFVGHAMDSVRSLSFSKLDPIVFEHKLLSDLNRTLQMMDSEYAECLGGNFQLVIDATKGTIMHIDIDRCFEHMRNHWGENCRQSLHDLVEYVIATKFVAAIENGGDDNTTEAIATSTISGSVANKPPRQTIHSYNATVERFNKLNFRRPSNWKNNQGTRTYDMDPSEYFWDISQDPWLQQAKEKERETRKKRRRQNKREVIAKKKQERCRQRQGEDIAAIPAVAPTAQEQPLHLQVTIPEEVSSGQTIRVQAPDGRTKRVVIPQGMGPGSKFIVEFNGPTALG